MFDGNQIIFQKSIDDFEIACNAQFWFRVQLPLNTDLKNVKLNFIKDMFDGPREGTQIIVWKSVLPKVQNPFPCLRLFLTQKTAN